MSSTHRQIIERYAAGTAPQAAAAQGLTPEQRHARPGPALEHRRDRRPPARLRPGVRRPDEVGDRGGQPVAPGVRRERWLQTRPHAMPMEEAVNLLVAHRQWMTHLLRLRPESDFAPNRPGVRTEAGSRSPR
ncbi:MAG: hypothetical protein U0800_12100 [Isosphaeraceae bacterium]